MRLSAEYLRERHEHWKRRIGDAGIWDAAKFRDVRLVVRPRCKSYNGLFIRRYLTELGQRKLIDRIFIYEKGPDFDPRFVDNILVHEMIHQYIIQNRLKDTSTHGTLFRSFMNKINGSFTGELKINISDRSPETTSKPERPKIHLLLILHREDGFSFCCIVNPGKQSSFENLLKNNARAWHIKEYFWARSKDPIFNHYSRCTKTLHGIKKRRGLIEEFCHIHGVEKFSN
ncbi:MAG: SprT-like domain-containing protein [Muribaculaceae bacterium]|nr:SprT-like domain-containing protein [Muribaculaceae bacterium]